MKPSTSFLLRIVFLLHTALFSVLAFAQNEGGSSSSEKTTTTSTSSTNIEVGTANADWYAQPWVWVVGAAAFILLLVALLRGSNSRRDTVTNERITVKKDNP